MAPRSDSLQTVKFSEPEILETGGTKVLRITAELMGFNADDLVVRPKDCQLLLLNKEEVVLSSYDLPESVDPFTVEATMSDAGLLMVQAPLKC